jgi:hypothetical protein
MTKWISKKEKDGKVRHIPIQERHRKREKEINPYETVKMSKIDLKKIDKQELFERLLLEMTEIPDGWYRSVFIENGKMFFSEPLTGNVLDKDEKGRIYSINKLLEGVGIPFYYENGYFYTKENPENCDWDKHISLTENDDDFKDFGYNHKHTLSEGLEELLEYNGVYEYLERMCSEWGCDKFF